MLKPSAVQTVFSVFLIFNIQIVTSREYLLKLTSDGPAIKGSTVTFTADLFELNGTHVVVTDTLKWDWSIDEHEKQEFRTKVPYAKWTYQFPRRTNKNPNKTYKLEVSVGQWYVFFAYPLASAHLEVNVTTLINGNMIFKQNGIQRMTRDIAIDEPMEQKLELRHADMASIENATSVIVHWLIDCNHIRQSKELYTTHLFGDSNKTHLIEALVEATFEPLPPKTLPTLKTKLISEWQTAHRNDLPYVCNNRSQITPDPSKVYGHFARNITTAEPISDLTLNGTIWAKKDDSLELDMYCNGSPNFEFCIRQINESKSLNGNETCDNWTSIKNCYQHFSLRPRFGNASSFTVLVIVRNSVSVERTVHIVKMKQPIFIVALVVGVVVFTLFVIAIVVCCIVRCIRLKKSSSNPPPRTEAETKLIGLNNVQVTKPKKQQKDADR